nr:hypothetical protein [Chlamydiota bacterium]
MHPLCRLVTFTSILGLSSIAHADTIEAGRDIEDHDIRALREWVETKRQVSLKEIGGDLSLSGEVRTEFQSSWENKNGKSQRGSDLSKKLPARGFDVEVNLMFDYRTDQTWASVKIEFDDDAGIFSGSLDSLALERAYWGVRAIDADDYTFDIEVGRRSMTSIFDSRIQFGSFFDGILFRYDLATESIGDFYLRAGPFVVNDRRDHFGYVGELGLLNIKGTGFYAKGSFIAWHTKRYPKSFVRNRFRFLNGQGILGYRFKVAKKIGIFYSAFLWNFAARKITLTDHKRANWATYVGVSVGQLLKQWDLAFDINYQAVSGQAIPDFDASGIGLGNADRSGFYTKKIKTIKGDGPSTRKTAAGTTNYRGFSITLDFLLTDKLDMQQNYVQSIT